MERLEDYYTKQSTAYRRVLKLGCGNDVALVRVLA